MIKIENYRQLHDTDNKEQGTVIVGTCLSTDEKPLEYAGGSILIETDHDGGFWVYMFDEASMTWILQTCFFDSSSIECKHPSIEEITSTVLARIPVGSHTKLGILQVDTKGLIVKNGVLQLDTEYIQEKLVEPLKAEMQEGLKQVLKGAKEYTDEQIAGING